MKFDLKLFDAKRNNDQILKANYKVELKINSFSLNSSVISIGSSSTQSDIQISANKMIEDNIIGISYSNERKTFSVVDLSYRLPNNLFVHL